MTKCQGECLLIQDLKFLCQMTNFILLSTIPIWCAKWWAFNRLILIIGEIILLILGWPWLRAKPLCIEIFCVVWGNTSNKIKELVLNNFDQKFMNWPEVCEILANATFLHWLRIQCIWSADFCTFTSCLIQICVCTFCSYFSTPTFKWKTKKNLKNSCGLDECHAFRPYRHWQYKFEVDLEGIKKCFWFVVFLKMI